LIPPRPFFYFIQARIGAYKPGLKMSGSGDVLRENGAVLLCDSFDRLSVTKQERIQSELRNLIRDFPRCQVFVFSRGASQPQLSLPVLSLKPLTSDQQRQIVEIF
jgi:hypothetical protein